MGWTKRQLIEDAFGELALAGFTFDLGPEELQAGLRRLDTLMAEWAGKNVDIGYTLPTGPSSSKLGDESGIAAEDVSGVVLQLALRLAATFGKQPPASLLTSAKQAYDALLARSVKRNTYMRRYPSGTPRGAGYKHEERPFFGSPDLTTAADVEALSTLTNETLPQAW